MDYIDCPKCGSEGCSSDFYYKSGEEYLFCGECGYARSVTIKNEARENKKYSELVESDWELKELVDPWGAYRLKEKGMVSIQCGSLTSHEQYGELLSLVEKHIDDVDEFVVSRYVDGKIVKFPVVESPRIINEINQEPDKE